MEVMFVDSIYKEYIWGGTRLEKEYNKENENRNIAESIEIAINKDESVKVKNGEFKGKTLFELFQNIYLKEKIFGRYAVNRKDFPIIIKFIDAEENLSIQVHPGDIINEKNELWYIVENSNESQVIAGLKNILILEIQQNSNITYRIFDWNSVDKCDKSRELHIVY